MSTNLREQLQRLPEYLGDHVFVTGIALALGISISLPLALLVARSRARWPVLAISGVIQTIPSLALLALMVPLLGAFGFWPALLALVLYSMLPVLRNTVTGIVNVDVNVLEAARAVGMTPGQVLRKVEFPLALPMIIAGVRTATVWVVGIATLTTPVGQPSLGNYIFGGLQTRNWTAVLVGCAAAAVLAIVLDLLLAGLERAVQTAKKPAAVLAVVGLGLVFGGGAIAPAIANDRAPAKSPGRAPTSASMSRPADSRSEPEAPSVLRVGAKTFTEQYILAALIAGRLQEAGFRVERVESLGSTVAFDALRANRIHVYVDYTGTIWANYMKRERPDAAWKVRAATAAWLANTHGIRALGALGFENAYCLAMRRDRASELGIESIEDLVAHAPALELGSDYEFFQRPEWGRLRETYGLEFAALRSFDSTFMYSAVKDGEVDVITAFSSDGRIAAFDLVVLSDSRQAFPPYDAVLLLAPEIAGDRRVVTALDPLVGAVPVEQMRQANLLVDGDKNKKTPGAAAAWLSEQLLK